MRIHLRGKRLLLWAALLVGLGLLCYPAVSQLVNLRNAAAAIGKFQQSMGETDLSRQRKLAEDYNRSLLRAEGQAEGYADILNISDGVMGYLKIPKIHVSLPIYHGTEEAVLRKGVGHLPGSAFPIGGKGNHAVLTGHTGLPSARLLTDLSELAEGDGFTVSILGQELAYQVTAIRVVRPDEGDALTPVPGEDLVTLVTCTPYGINSHRLLVTGTRVEPAE
ncbi:MAG: class C sortase [Eubacteriales bacterium]|nr:class C sortase [Eubacteriales bacterium]